MKPNKGSVQIWIHEHGGVKFIRKLFKRFPTAEALRNYLFEEYGFQGTHQSLRNYMVKHKIKRKGHGDHNFGKHSKPNATLNVTQQHDYNELIPKSRRTKHKPTFKRVPGCSKKEWKKKVAQAQGKISRMKYDIEDM